MMISKIFVYSFIIIKNLFFFFSGQTIVTRLQTANPNLLDGLRMQFQNAQNEGQSPPHNGFPDDDNQS